MLDGLLLVARAALAAVFATAGAAKLADREGSRRALVRFGLPQRLAVPAAVALPLAELATAGALLPAASARWAALASLALLTLFAAAIAVNLARGRRPDCHCFGQLHSAPAGAGALVRNVALAGLAAFVVALGWQDAGPGAFAWIMGLEGVAIAAAAAAVATLVAVAAVVAVLQTLRSYGRVLLRLDRLEAALAAAGIELELEHEAEEIGLPVGAPAPTFALPDLSDRTVSLPDLLGENHPALLVFADPGCRPCHALMPRVAEWQREHVDELAVVVVSAGSREDVRAEVEEHELGLVLLDGDRRLYESLDVAGTPGAVLLRPDGTIGSGVAGGAEAIEQLVERALGEEVRESRLPVGSGVPALRLADLGGRKTALRTVLRGREAIVLFWNPECGFCRAMHEELLAWEESTFPDAPRLVVVSSGEREAVRAEGFRSQVLLDPDFAAGETFGTDGTPTAILVDGEGRVASGIVTGARQIFALTRSRSEVRG